VQPSDIEGAHGVQVVAQLPQPGQILFPKDATHPSLWYFPAAAFSEGAETRMWYQRVDKGEKEYSDQRTLCMGILKNETWETPALADGAAPWGGPNNVVMRRSPHQPTWGGFNVFQILREDTGYRMLYWDQPEHGEAGAMLAASKDGIHWDKDPRGAVFTEHNDAFTVLKKDGKYLLYQTILEDWPDKPVKDNLGKWRRVMALRESADLSTWTKPAVLLHPDAEDKPDAEFYYLKVFPYAGRYLGLLMKYYADPSNPGKHSAIMPTELIVSDDARTWTRPYRATDLGFWSAADPAPVNGSLVFFKNKDGALSLLKYRPFGITAVKADGQGEFVTQPFSMPASGLTINADTRGGWIEVQLLDEDKKPVESANAQRIAETDGAAIPLRWPAAVMERASGTACRLRVRMDKSSLYAFGTANG
ncbi:MAG: hypothetical protein HZB26_14305, partial [Candidatus Hydrogenedentes bacterium]|nr:hypothetical protein [Candidatus Hydrogenedentota bacterium]